MVAPIHLGVEHPSLVWSVAVAILAFAAGLGVNLYRSLRADRPRTDPSAGDGERP